jgi:hypothetical protein
MEGGGRGRAVDRDDVDARQHLVEAVPVGGLELIFGGRIDTAAVVIMDRQAEGLGAAGHGGADAAHADDAEPLAANAVAEHPGRRPALPAAIIADNDIGALGQPPRHGQHQCHGHVGGVIGKHVGGVGDGDALFLRGIDIDVVDAIAEIGDQLHLRAGLLDQRRVDLVGHGGHQNIGRTHGRNQFGLGARLVVDVEFGVKQLAHARFHMVRQAAGDIDLRFFSCSASYGRSSVESFFNQTRRQYSRYCFF